MSKDLRPSWLSKTFNEFSSVKPVTLYGENKLLACIFHFSKGGCDLWKAVSFSPIFLVPVFLRYIWPQTPVFCHLRFLTLRKMGLRNKWNQYNFEIWITTIFMQKNKNWKLFIKIQKEQSKIMTTSDLPYGI